LFLRQRKGALDNEIVAELKINLVIKKMRQYKCRRLFYNGRINLQKKEVKSKSKK